MGGGGDGFGAGGGSGYVQYRSIHVESESVVSTVISSALRVRDIDTLQGRKASHQVENGGMMYIKDEYQNQL